MIIIHTFIYNYMHITLQFKNYWQIFSSSHSFSLALSLSRTLSRTLSPALWLPLSLLLSALLSHTPTYAIVCRYLHRWYMHVCIHMYTRAYINHALHIFMCIDSRYTFNINTYILCLNTTTVPSSISFASSSICIYLYVHSICISMPCTCIRLYMCVSVSEFGGLRSVSFKTNVNIET